MQAYFVFHSACTTFSQKEKVACTTFSQKEKVGGASEIKICKHILYFIRLALPLRKKKGKKIMDNADFEGYTGISIHNITFSNDIMLVVVLVFLTALACVFSLNFPLFGKMISNIRAGEQRQSIFETTEQNNFLFNTFMTFQTLVLCSIYLFSAAVKYQYIHNADIQTTLLSIGLLLVLFLIYYLFKRVLYALFGVIFIEKSTIKMLITNYQALLSTWGVALYLPVLWILLSDTYLFITIITLIFSYLLFKIILALRFIHVFYKKNTGFLFLILYLCAQEIAPLVFLYQGMIFMYNIIERNYAWQ